VEPRSVALVHDYLLVARGAERTFAAIASCWPDSPIFTLLYDQQAMEGLLGHRDVKTSYLQRLGIRQAGFRRLLPLFPRASERMPVQGHDLVISSSSAFAHGVRPDPQATHIVYCHTPFRYAWQDRDRTLAEAHTLVRPALRRTLGRIARWDVAAAGRVTHYIANAEVTRERIGEYYGRDASVIHPPVEVDRFSIGSPEDFFLVVTELVPHKRVENALEAARRAKVPIAVVGGGRLLDQLSREYGKSAIFHGRVSDAELVDLYRRARALVVPNVEEFGIAAVEGQASGRPVLAADAGGARETVIEGETGVRVPPDDVDALAEAMREVDWEGFDPKRIREHSLRFSIDEFKRRFTSQVTSLVAGAGNHDGACGSRPEPLRLPEGPQGK
jgi:glycosyltransferase involved in cell wall biosynthesis